MRKVIDGRVYDTTKATEIDRDSHGYGGDFGQWEETLYVTVKGRYFLAGSGGPNSSWAESLGNNSWGGGRGIRVLDKGDALRWCEAHGVGVDTIAEHFEIEPA